DDETRARGKTSSPTAALQQTDQRDAQQQRDRIRLQQVLVAVRHDVIGENPEQRDDRSEETQEQRPSARQHNEQNATPTVSHERPDESEYARDHDAGENVPAENARRDFGRRQTVSRDHHSLIENEWLRLAVGT